MTLDHEDVEAVAKRMVELLHEQDDVEFPREGGTRLVDVATMARLLGVSTTTVYAKSKELGAIRVGSGPRAPLRFDPARAISSQPSNDPAAPAVATPRRRARSRPKPDSGKLLPIRGGETQRRVP